MKTARGFRYAQTLLLIASLSAWGGFFQIRFITSKQKDGFASLMSYLCELRSI